MKPEEKNFLKVKIFSSNNFLAEKNLILMEQIELQRQMQDFSRLIPGYYTTLAIQFGY